MLMGAGTMHHRTHGGRLTIIYIQDCMLVMRRTAEDAAQTRRAIIRAALREFSSSGWAGGSLVAVSRRAGLTRGAVYHHFENKEAVLRAVLVEEWPLQMTPLLDALGDDSLPPSDRLLGFLSSYLRMLTESELFRDLAVVSTVVAPQALELATGVAEKRQALGAWSDRLIPLLTACGPLREEMTIPEAVFVIFTFVHGLTLAAAVEPALLPKGAGVEAMSRAIIYGLLPTRTASL
ncbi:TetR/AcrR family transcriptional regulator [Microbacterium sp. NPDC089698]|uniref:TetR/AcrR family transcriptional regulator n=1 Tax=Microbacterium sp. NPDC089698 TaxID=3364200 RepID=UPI0037F732DC